MVREILKYFWRKKTMLERQRQFFIDKISNLQNPSDEFEQEALLGAQTIGGQSFYFTLKELDSLIDKRVGSRPSINFHSITLKVAASIFIVILAATVYIHFSPKNSSELVAEYFEPFPNTLAPIQRGVFEGDALNNAMTYYESEQYQQAAIELENYVLTPNAKPEAYLYLGVAYLSLQKPDQSLINLSKVDDFAVTEIKEAALWYSTLAYLSLEEKKRAKQMAQEVIKLEGFYRDKAQEIEDSI